MKAALSLLWAAACIGCATGASRSQATTTVPEPPATSSSSLESLEAFERACELGSSRGCNDLGIKYIDGDGVRRDVKRGFELVARA